MGIGKAIGSAALGGLTGGVGGLVSGAIGGLGKGYEQSYNSKRNAYRENNTNEYYRLPNGMELPLPEYYRKKIYNEEEREKLWIEKQERGYRYICGEKASIS